MNPQPVGSRDAGKVAPVYLFWNGELMIDAPAKTVWRHALNYPSWQNFSIIEPISGVPGEVGEVILLKKEEAGVEFPPYYARTIKLEPESRVIWKTYPEKTTPECNFFGIVAFSVYEAAGKTRFCYDVLYEFLVSYREEKELEAFHKRQHESSQAVFSSVLAKLKALAERGA